MTTYTPPEPTSLAPVVAEYLLEAGLIDHIEKNATSYGNPYRVAMQLPNGNKVILSTDRTAEDGETYTYTVHTADNLIGGGSGSTYGILPAITKVIAEAQR